MITKEEFDSLYTDEITVKKYNEIIKKIDKRFAEICQKFLIKNSQGWFDYDNHYDYGYLGGRFDPIIYKENISIDGNFQLPPGYDESIIPTRWLWEKNWENEVKEKIQKEKEKEKIQKEKLRKEKAFNKKEKNRILKSIKNKLTKEELDFLNIKEIK